MLTSWKTLASMFICSGARSKFEVELSYFSQLTVSEVEGLVQIYKYWITFISWINGFTGFRTLEAYIFIIIIIFIYSLYSIIYSLLALFYLSILYYYHFSAGTFLCTTIHQRHIFGWPRAEKINFKWNSGDSFLNANNCCEYTNIQRHYGPRRRLL